MGIHYHNHTIHVQAQAAGTAKRLKQDMANAQAGFLRRREPDGEGGMPNGKNSVQTNVDARLSDSPDCLREGLEKTGAGLDGGSSRRCQSVRHSAHRPKTGWPETFFGGCSPRGKTALVRIREVKQKTGGFSQPKQPHRTHSRHPERFWVAGGRGKGKKVERVRAMIQTRRRPKPALGREREVQIRGGPILYHCSYFRTILIEEKALAIFPARQGTGFARHAHLHVLPSLLSGDAPTDRGAAKRPRSYHLRQNRVTVDSKAFALAGALTSDVERGCMGGEGAVWAACRAAMNPRSDPEPRRSSGKLREPLYF